MRIAEEIYDEMRSPSPRRAWIEMLNTRACFRRAIVALPTEGVD